MDDGTPTHLPVAGNNVLIFKLTAEEAARHAEAKRVAAADRDHESVLHLADKAVAALHETKDRLNCVAVVATGPAAESFDSGFVQVFSRWCCRWHAYAFLGALDEVRYSILHSLTDPENDQPPPPSQAT